MKVLRYKYTITSAPATGSHRISVGNPRDVGWSLRHPQCLNQGHYRETASRHAAQEREDLPESGRAGPEPCGARLAFHGSAALGGIISIKKEHSQPPGAELEVLYPKDSRACPEHRSRSSLASFTDQAAKFLCLLVS
jgi:hypothetical protein